MAHKVKWTFLNLEFTVLLLVLGMYNFVCMLKINPLTIPTSQHIPYHEYLMHIQKNSWEMTDKEQKHNTHEDGCQIHFGGPSFVLLFGSFMSHLKSINREWNISNFKINVWFGSRDPKKQKFDVLVKKAEMSCGCCLLSHNNTTRQLKLPAMLSLNRQLK